MYIRRFHFHIILYLQDYCTIQIRVYYENHRILFNWLHDIKRRISGNGQIHMVIQNSKLDKLLRCFPWHWNWPITALHWVTWLATDQWEESMPWSGLHNIWCCFSKMISNNCNTVRNVWLDRWLVRKKSVTAFVCW